MSGKSREYLINCEVCGAEVTTHSPTIKYCKDHKNQKYKQYVHVFEGIQNGIKGSCGELTVCVDLLSKGWEVFRSVSPHSSVDVIACKLPEKTLYIEVTCGVINHENGAMYFQKHEQHRNKRNLLAVVFKDKILYFDNNDLEVTI